MAIRKRMSRKELQKTDPLTAALEDFVSKLVHYRVPLVAAGVAGVALLAVSVGYRQWTDAEAVKRAEAVSEAFAVLGGTVGEATDEELPGAIKRMNFSDDQAKRDALAEKVGAVAATYEGGKLGALAQLIQASESKDGADLAAVRDVSATLLDGETAIGSWINMGLGRIAWRAGDSAAANEGFSSLATNQETPLATRVTAQIHLGDLVNPAFGGKGDAEKARSAYREALKLIDTSVQSRSGSLKELRGAVAVRLALLPGGAAEILKPASADAPAPVPTQTASP